MTVRLGTVAQHGVHMVIITKSDGTVVRIPISPMSFYMLKASIKVDRQ